MQDRLKEIRKCFSKNNGYGDVEYAQKFDIAALENGLVLTIGELQSLVDLKVSMDHFRWFIEVYRAMNH